jgi:hypothetical protein
MYKSLVLGAMFLASIAVAQASAQEPTNSGTSSYLAELVRAKAATKQDNRYQPKTTLPTNWAQDHWR